MIIDIPGKEDFEKTAISLLNLAWETTLNLTIQLSGLPKLMQHPLLERLERVDERAG
jgi:hypothetical protein